MKHDSMLPSLGRNAAAGLMALVLLGLPSGPSPVRGQTEDVQNRVSAVLLMARQEDELRKLQAEAERKMAEVATLKAKIAVAKVARENRDDVRVIKAAEPTVTIHISGLKATPDDLKKLVEALQKELPNAKVKEVAHHGAVDRLIIRGRAAPVPPVPPVPPTPAVRPGGGVEKKLDDLLRQIEALRHEMKGGRPGAPAFNPAR